MQCAQRSMYVAIEQLLAEPVSALVYCRHCNH
jgi:hypothetical protein